MKVCDLMRLQRNKMNLLQKDLAKMVGVSQQAVLSWENKNIIPEDDNLLKISKVLKLDLQELLKAKQETIDYKNNNYCVYKHTSPSQKVYIGITKQSTTRRWQYGKGYEGNSHFINAINKYGWSNFQHEIMAKNLSVDEAKEKEIELIRQYKSNERDYGYNISPGGDTVAEESISKNRRTRAAHNIKEKERERMIARWSDPEIRAKTVASMKGKKRTEEQKERMKATNARKGKPLPKDTKEKLRKINEKRTGELSPRSRKVVAINPYTGNIDHVFISAREAAKAFSDKSISAISNICRAESNSRGFKHGYFWSWQDTYYEGKFPIIKEDDLNKAGRLKREKETIWSYNHHITDKQKEAISIAHRKPVMCLESGEIFTSIRLAGSKLGIDPSTISRQINGKQKTAGGFTWCYVDNKDPKQSI